MHLRPPPPADPPPPRAIRVRLDPALLAALTRFCARTHRDPAATIAAAVELLLESGDDAAERRLTAGLRRT